MIGKEKKALRLASPYSAVLTREQFLFYETRTTAKLLCEGLSKDKVVKRIVEENLFQYPTEKNGKEDGAYLYPAIGGISGQRSGSGYCQSAQRRVKADMSLRNDASV